MEWMCFYDHLNCQMDVRKLLIIHYHYVSCNIGRTFHVREIDEIKKNIKEIFNFFIWNL